jgi:osmotically-inducible protein OsmY
MDMKRSRLCAIACSAILLNGLAGCAVYQQYRQCGFFECPSDAKISADVKAHFRQHTATEPPNVIYVQTFNHVVYLSGLVDSVSDIDTAEAVARQTPGVTDVVSSFGMNP